MLTHARLKELVHYDPTTGIFLWKVNRRGPAKRGDIVGNPMKDGHLQACIDGHRTLVHVFAWFYMTGEWPPQDIDHRNRVPDDNRWENLRLASMSQNQQNQSLSSRNKSGFKGVFFVKEKNRWLASIKAEGKSKHLGYFSSKEEAAVAYAVAAQRYFGEFANPARSVT